GVGGAGLAGDRVGSIGGAAVGGARGERPRLVARLHDLTVKARAKRPAARSGRARARLRRSDGWWWLRCRAAAARRMPAGRDLVESDRAPRREPCLDIGAASDAARTGRN